MKNTQSVIKYFLVLSILYTSLMGFERRRDQYNHNSGYFVVPAAYSIPGIGEGVAYVGMASNIYNSQTDVFANIITGDVDGYGLGVTDLYLIGKELKLDIYYAYINNSSIQSYTTRGMNSAKDEYVNLGVKELNSFGMRLTSSYFEKQIEFYLLGQQNSYSIDFLKDKDKNTILDTTGDTTQKSTSLTAGFTLDLTDDRVDPRLDIRYDLSFDYGLQTESNAVDYYIKNHNLSFYIPLGKVST